MYRKRLSSIQASAVPRLISAGGRSCSEWKRGDTSGLLRRSPTKRFMLVSKARRPTNSLSLRQMLGVPRRSNAPWKRFRPASAVNPWRSRKRKAGWPYIGIRRCAPFLEVSSRINFYFLVGDLAIRDPHLIFTQSSPRHLFDEDYFLHYQAACTCGLPMTLTKIISGSFTITDAIGSIRCSPPDSLPTG